jgi:hypothetical protein
MALQLVLISSPRIPALAANLVQLWPNPAEVNTTKLAASTIAKLNSYDLVLLLDSSGSMNDKDCPAQANNENFRLSKEHNSNDCLTRWQWCAQELSDFDKQAKGVLSEPLRVASFAKKTHDYSGLTFSTVSQVFYFTSPKGNTDTTAAMKAELADYLEKKTKGEHQKPLLLAVISDCCPDNKISVKETLKKLSQTTNPKEICVVFLQIGNDKNGNRFLEQLNEEVSKGRIRADLLRSVSFSQILEGGVAKALIDVAHSQEELATSDAP